MISLMSLVFLHTELDALAICVLEKVYPFRDSLIRKRLGFVWLPKGSSLRL